MGDRLPYRYEVELDFDRYEYRTTEGQRKCWDGEPDLTEEGWEEYAEWERFDYTEERYWRRPLNDEQLAAVAKSKASRARAEAVAGDKRDYAIDIAKRKVIEAAKWLREQVARPGTRLTGSLTGATLQLCKATAALIAAEQEGE